MFHIIYAVLLLTLFPRILLAENVQNRQHFFMRQYQSSRVMFPDKGSTFASKNPGRYPSILNYILGDLWSWSPKGLGEALSEDCSIDLWSSRVQDSRIKSSVQLQGAVLQKYFKNCAREIETDDTSVIANLTKMMTMKLTPQEHPFLHRVVFNLPGNIKLKGLLGLKGDIKKRPLVVLRLGIFSNIEEFMPERAWLMMLFEQSPFNILLLENITSSDFIANNSRFSFGGYDEALQNILVAQILKDPNEPLSRIVDSLHLFGVSLGGHGVLYASLLNELNSPKGKPLYNSFLAMCPVVNLKENMNYIVSEAPFSWGVDFWSRRRLAGLSKNMSSVNEHESFGYLKKAISEVVRTYQGGLSYVSSLRLPEGMQDGSSFWKLNDFWSSYKNVRQPVLIMSTQTDVLVPFAMNSQRLMDKSLRVQSENISVVNYSKGIHCTLPISYDWKVVSSLLQAFFISHSPNFSLKEQVLEMDLGDESSGDFYKGSLVVRSEVQRPEVTDKFVRVAVEFKNNNGKSERLKLSLPLAQFDFLFYNPKLSSSEQLMIERWVNHNLQLRVVQKNKKPMLRISWPVAP